MSIIKSTTAALALKSLSLSLALASQIVLARFTTTDEFGAFAFVFNLVMLLAVVSGLGLPASTVRIVSRGLVSERNSYAQQVMKWGIGLAARSAIVVAVLGSVAAYLFEESLDDSYYPAVYIGLWLIPPITVVNVQSGVIRGSHNPVLGLFPDLMGRHLVIILSACTAAVLFTQVSAQQVLAGAVFGFVVLIWLQRLLFSRSTVNQSEEHESSRRYQELWRETIPFYILSVSQNLVVRLDVLLVSVLLEAADAAVFFAAARIASLVSVPLDAIVAYSSPKFSSLYSQSKVDLLSNVVRKSMRLCLLPTVATLIVIYFFAHSFLGVFGRDYLIGRDALVLLASGHLLRMLFGPVLSLLSMTGRVWTSVVISLVSALVGLVLSIILIPVIGMIGAALSTVIMLGILSILSAIFVYRHLGMLPFSWVR